MRSRRRGFTLAETLIALSVTVVGTLTAASVLISSMKLDRVNRESDAAFAAARAQIESVRAQSFTQVLDLYDTDPANDPSGAGTAPGKTFWNATLAKLGSQAAVTAEVLLPLNDAGEVREDLTIPELGLPGDLNGDGLTDALDHRDDCVVLPVAVRVRWTGQTGERTYVLATMVHP